MIATAIAHSGSLRLMSAQFTCKASPCAGQQLASRRRQPRPLATRPVAHRSEASPKSSVHVGVEPAPQPYSLPLANQPWYIRGPAVLLLLGVLLRVLKGVVNSGSAPSDLELRGFLDESRNERDPFLDDVMKNVNKMQYGDLTEEQIAAARQRRSREMNPVDFDNLELPPNHPFAMKRKVTKDEEELVRQRLEVKRGLPLQDLAGNRGFPAE